MRRQRWTHRPEILSYVIDSYAGTEKPEGQGASRRVFIWEDGAEIKMGNTEAFMLHLCAKFDLILTASSGASLHELLRELGECVQSHKEHAPRSLTGPSAGKFRQPEPDEWVVGRVQPKGE